MKSSCICGDTMFPFGTPTINSFAASKSESISFCSVSITFNLSTTVNANHAPTKHAATMLIKFFIGIETGVFSDIFITYVSLNQHP